jgi:hypothetical protein
MNQPASNPPTLEYISDTYLVEVYRTTVDHRQEADRLLRQLRRLFPAYRINFDLEDCDLVLRVETFGDPAPSDVIARLLWQNGYYCEPLPD